MNHRIFSAAAALIASAALASGALAPAAMAKADPKPAQVEQDARPASAKVKYCAAEVLTGSRIRKQQCMSRSEWIAQTGVDPAVEAAKK